MLGQHLLLEDVHGRELLRLVRVDLGLGRSGLDRLGGRLGRRHARRPGRRHARRRRRLAGGNPHRVLTRRWLGGTVARHRGHAQDRRLVSGHAGREAGAELLGHEGIEGAPHLLGREGPVARILREQGVEEIARSLGQTGGRLGRRRIRVGGKNSRGAVALEGRRAGDHLEEHAAEGVEIAAKADELALGLLRRDVGGRAQHVEDGVGLDLRGQTRVQERDALHAALPRAQHDVLGLEVAMEQARAMQLVEGARDLRGHGQGVGSGERSIGQTRAQSLAFDPFAEEPETSLGLTRDDRQREVRVVEGRLLHQLALDALLLRGRARGGRRDQLEHALASAAHVFDTKERACGAGCEGLEHLEALFDFGRDRFHLALPSRIGPREHRNIWYGTNAQGAED